jgi:SP family sugar:H+ symporter-like MFS transporter
MTEPSAARANMGFIAAIVAVATIGGFLFGYDSGAVNGTQEGLKTTFGLSETTLGLTVSSLLIGCAAGSFLAGRLADVWGRRNVMMLAALAFLISALIAGGASSAGVFVAARLLGGMAVGAASVLSPAYISEVTPAGIRGRLSSVQQIMIITGLTGAFLVNYFLAHRAGVSTAPVWGHAAWRWMFWMQAIPAAIFILALFTIPESPRFLVLKGRDEKAHAVLARLFGSDAVARQKVDEIRASLSADHKPRFSDLLDPAKGGLRMVVWAGLMLAVFQQLVGINVIFYYGATLWQLAGFSENDALLINIASGALSIAACIGTMFVIDKVGRKPLLLIGSAGMAVTLFALVFAFHSGSLDPAGKLVLGAGAGKVALVAANLYVIFFNMSWGPVMWVMLGEMFPNQFRGSALAVCGLAQWLANFVISSTFPVMAVRLGLTLSYTFYGVCAVISYFLVAKLIRETKGMELEEMRG